jgi:uncharacterized paraquat-inducible protein A
MYVSMDATCRIAPVRPLRSCFAAFVTREQARQIEDTIRRERGWPELAPEPHSASSGLLQVECGQCHAINYVYDPNVCCYRCGESLTELPDR